MARKRPTASDAQPPRRGQNAAQRAAADVLTRAQARALSRSAPLTPAEFKTHRLRIEQGAVSLRTVLDGAPIAPLTPASSGEPMA